MLLLPVLQAGRVPQAQAPAPGAVGEGREKAGSAGRRSSRALSPAALPLYRRVLAPLLTARRPWPPVRLRGPGPAGRGRRRAPALLPGRGLARRPQARVPAVSRGRWLAAGPGPRAARPGADYNSQRSPARPSGGGGGRENESGGPGSRLRPQAAA